MLFFNNVPVKVCLLNKCVCIDHLIIMFAYDLKRVKHDFVKLYINYIFLNYLAVYGNSQNVVKRSNFNDVNWN